MGKGHRAYQINQEGTHVPTLKKAEAHFLCGPLHKWALEGTLGEPTPNEPVRLTMFEVLDVLSTYQNVSGRAGGRAAGPPGGRGWVHTPPPPTHTSSWCRYFSQRLTH